MYTSKDILPNEANLKSRLLCKFLPLLTLPGIYLAPVHAQQTPPTVSMTLRVKVPANTPANDTIFIYNRALFLAGGSQIQMSRVSGTTDTWQATISAPEGTLFRYYYNRNGTFVGSNQYEDDAFSAGAFPVTGDYRLLLATNGAVVDDTIAKWTDLPAAANSTGTVKGKVTDNAGKPLVWMPVSAGPRQGLTDINGDFLLDSVPAGPIAVTVFAESGEYKVEKATVDVPVGGAATKDFVLTAASMNPVTFNVTLPSDSPAGAIPRLYGDAYRLGMAPSLNGDGYYETTRALEMTPAGGSRWTITVQLGNGMCVNYLYTLGTNQVNNERTSPNNGTALTRSLCVNGPTTVNDTVATWKTPQQVAVSLTAASPTLEDILYVTTDNGSGLSVMKMWPTGPGTAAFTIYANANSTLNYRYIRNADTRTSVEILGADIVAPNYRTIATGSGVSRADTVAAWRNQALEPALTTVATGITRPIVSRPDSAPFIGGVFHADWWEPKWLPFEDSTMAWIKSKNSQWVMIWDERGIRVLDNPRFDLFGNSHVPGDLVAHVRAAKAAGLRVALKTGAVKGAASNPLFTGVHSTAWFDQVFDELRRHFLACAKFAQEEGVEILVLDNGGWVWPDESSESLRYANFKWKEVIAAIRASGYTGKLMNSQLPGRAEFDWVGDLDFIGDNWHASAKPLAVTDHDTVQSMYDAAVAWLNSQYLPVVNRYHKPVLFQAIAFYSVNGTAAGQYVHDDTRLNPFKPADPSAVSDYDEQARAYQAVLLALQETPWVAGAFSFGYHPYNMDGKSESIRGKTAEEIQSQIFQQVNAKTMSASCGYALNSGGQTLSAAGGSGAITVTAGSGCAWSVEALPSWITSNSTGTGNGTVNYTVAPNAGAARTAEFVVAGTIFNIEQASGQTSTLPAAGSFAHVTSQGTWKFTLAAVNLGNGSATGRFTFAGDSGSPLALPLTSDQPAIPLMSGPLMASTLERTLAPNAQYVTESTGPNSAPALIGSGQMFASGNLSAFGIFSNPTYHWDAVVPVETRNASRYVLAFDNTGVLVTGVAVSNVAATAAVIPVVIRDDAGNQIFSGSMNLVAQGHTSFMLNQQYSVTNGKRGTIEFQTPQGGQISVLGLRANGPALTTLPVLASSDIPGGAIAHATYNGGFTSTFYLVNTGAASASFTLSFFDESGNPLSVPLRLPQTGATSTTSALTQTLGAGAMLVVETVANDAAASVVGSAQLTTTGSVSGFEIFKWTTFGQEASVPLETRTPGSFVLVFDDTNGLTTGVALANVAATGASITAKIYDDAGTLLQTVSVPLSARGHTSFLLPNTFSVTENRRGMVEFVVPSGGKINAIGLRAKADGTLTTIPVLTK